MSPTPPDRAAVALHHASILQDRRRLEAQILDSLILLSEYPLVRSPRHSAAAPAASDVADFRAHVRLFQPSDYADLVEERNVNGLCGYVLCPRPRRHTGPGGEWIITACGDIVRRKDIEMWCSKQCARRALFVKVQLNETAAWERAGIPDIQIQLLDRADESSETEAVRTVRKLGDMKVEDQRHATRQAAALALERGERGAASALDKVNFTLKEKDTLPPKPAISTPIVHDGHLLVEGHKSQLAFRPRQSSAYD